MHKGVVVDLKDETISRSVFESDVFTHLNPSITIGVEALYQQESGMDGDEGNGNFCDANLERLCERLDNDARSDEAIECDPGGRSTHARDRRFRCFDIYKGQLCPTHRLNY